ncbi:hypothetical protein [Pseudoalteromonas sp. NBT06-2]|nr:hypothetical protein [Pseudoalteromonas sp. NBT06-2]
MSKLNNICKGGCACGFVRYEIEPDPLILTVAIVVIVSDKQALLLL